MKQENEVRAYQRGWNEAQAWMVPHLNPYPVGTPEWSAWWLGYNEGHCRGDGKIIHTVESSS